MQKKKLKPVMGEQQSLEMITKKLKMSYKHKNPIINTISSYSE
ncbi:hypothetical protein [Liquorilactobacillus mali]|nr:hypothetical protein [Liquorilactobacillus mali]